MSSIKTQWFNLHLYSLQKPQSSACKDPALSKLNRFCRDSRCLDQWVPVINLPERWDGTERSHHQSHKLLHRICVYLPQLNPWTVFTLPQGGWQEEENWQNARNKEILSTSNADPEHGDFLSGQRARHEQEAWLSRMLAMLTRNEQRLLFWNNKTVPEIKGPE